MEYTITVDICPQAALRTRSAGKVHYTPKKYKEWMDEFDILAKSAFSRSGGEKVEDPSTPIEVNIYAYIPIPKSRLSGKNAIKDGSWHTQKPDRDNIEKAVLDGLVRIGAFPDDAQVCAGVTQKRWGSRFGIIVIKVRTLA